VSIWNGLSILHNDLNMPLCGHTLYAKEYSDKTVESSYTEETIDKRTIQSRSIRMDRCDHLKVRNYLIMMIIMMMMIVIMIVTMMMIMMKMMMMMMMIMMIMMMMMM
jgi:hypothetical protein